MLGVVEVELKSHHQDKYRHVCVSPASNCIIFPHKLEFERSRDSISAARTNCPFPSCKQKFLSRQPNDDKMPAV